MPWIIRRGSIGHRDEGPRSSARCCVRATGLLDIRPDESFDQLVIREDAPVVVYDVSRDPRSDHNPSIDLLGIRAWAGFPLRSAAGDVLGTFYAADPTVSR